MCLALIIQEIKIAVINNKKKKKRTTEGRNIEKNKKKIDIIPVLNTSINHKMVGGMEASNANQKTLTRLFKIALNIILGNEQIADK